MKTEIKVTIAHIAAEIVEAILVPGQNGYYSVEVKVPGGIAATAAAPLIA